MKPSKQKSNIRLSKRKKTNSRKVQNKFKKTHSRQQKNNKKKRSHRKIVRGGSDAADIMARHDASEEDKAEEQKKEADKLIDYIKTLNIDENSSLIKKKEVFKSITDYLINDLMKNLDNQIAKNAAELAKEKSDLKFNLIACRAELEAMENKDADEKAKQDDKVKEEDKDDV